MPKTIRFNGIAQRQSGGRTVLTIQHDDGCEIETTCTTVADLKDWLDARLSLVDEQTVAMVFARIALEKNGNVNAINTAHKNKTVTIDLGKDTAGPNALVRAV